MIAVASAGLNAAGAVQQHQAKGQAVDARNRAKLRNYDEDVKQYDRDVMFDRAEYKNEVIVNDIEQDDVYMAMINQWKEQDLKLDELFHDKDLKLEEAIREYYSNDYAGTQTGRTAASCI